jgi:hypothetical protein
MKLKQLSIKVLQTLAFLSMLACFGSYYLLPGIYLENTRGIYPESEVTIILLAEGKKTIPIYYRYYETWNTNIKLPVIVVTNKGDIPAFITGIDVIGKSNSKEVSKNRFYKEEIDKLIKETNVLLNRLISDPDNPWNVYNLKKRFGRVVIPKEGFQEKNQLKKDEGTAVDLSAINHFLYEGSARVDEIILQVKIDNNGKESVCDYPVILTPYTCKENYIFPVKGSATVSAMPLNEANGHRGLPSSEFAIDIIDVRRLPGGELSSSSPHHSNNVKDYFIFERDTLAAGDGVVAAIGNKWPNKLCENPLRYSVKRITNLTVNLLKKGAEFENAYIGNYVIIDHRNGEFSAYVHLSENSITVEQGDEVKQGQVIAKVGNTANSTEPHLHFQLMDGKDYASANGLPVMFNNLPAPLEPVHDFAEVNTLIYSDYLFLFIK